MRHPEWSELTIADVWRDERARLMPLPSPFDGYVGHPVRVSATSLIHYQRNRYSVPCEWVNAVVSPFKLSIFGRRQHLVGTVFP